MKAEEVNINEVFDNTRLMRIPFFQREYKWEEDAWDRLAEDMESLLDRHNGYKYFLGSLILKEDLITPEEQREGISTKYNVVDGQQRLTTLSVYLKVLVEYADDQALKRWLENRFFRNDDLRIPIIEHNLVDRNAYQDVMWGNPFNQVYSSERIINAYKHFKQRYANSGRTSEEVINLIQAIKDHVTFVKIALNDQDDEQQIFDTINSLGVKLTIDELMKNFLYNSQTESEYRNNWKPAFDDDEVKKFWQSSDAPTAQAANYQNTVIYNFFYDFVRIKMWDYDTTANERKEFVQKYKTLETCKAFVDKFGTSKQELANEIIAYAYLYREHFNKQNLDKPITRVPDISRIASVAMVKDATIRPYLLYILKNVEDEAERNRIFGFLETFIVRRIICDCDNKMASEFYTEQLIGKKINTAEKLMEYILNMDSDKNMHMPNDDEVIEKIHSSLFTKEVTPRLILFLSEIRNNRNVNEHPTFNNTFSEMIIPDLRDSEIYPRHQDQDAERERRRRIKTIGNYFLFRLNVDSDKDDEEKAKQRKRIIKEVGSHKAESFSNKKNSLNQYFNNLQCMQWVNDKRSWDEDDIDMRNKLLAEMINRLWPDGRQ